jgi:hypothetical protein
MTAKSLKKIYLKPELTKHKPLKEITLSVECEDTLPPCTTVQTEF